MALIETGFEDTTAHGAIRRPDGLSFVANAVMPMAVFLALNVYAAAGFGVGMPALAIAAPFGASGWLVAAAWMLALTSWGLVRWAVAERGAAGHTAADWLLVLIAAAIAFPFITLGFDFFWTAVAAFVLGLLALGTLRRVAIASPLAGLAMAPSILALLLPGLAGFSALAMGWTPPFAVTQAVEAPVPSSEDA